MAKDPAVLWYWNDWGGGTRTLSRHLKGCYIDLLEAQFNSGHLSLEEIKTVLGADFGNAWPTLQKKFKKDENGLFFNDRTEQEILKRKAFTESRRESLVKNENDMVKIYLLRDENTGYTKIATSKNPVKTFFGTSETKILIWASETVLRKEEANLHKEFEQKKIKGQWYNLNNEDIFYISHKYNGMDFRTAYRTENRNENRNINNKIQGGEGEPVDEVDQEATRQRALAKKHFDVLSKSSIWKETTLIAIRLPYSRAKNQEILLDYLASYFQIHSASGELTNDLENHKRHFVKWARTQISKDQEILKAKNTASK